MGLVSAVKAKVHNLIVQQGSPMQASSGEVSALVEVLQDSPGITGVLVALHDGMETG